MLDVTFESLDRFRRFMGYEWMGPWQLRMAMHFCEHRYAAFKGPRQLTGKSWFAGELIVPYFLLMGQPVVCVFPTLRVGSWVLMENVDRAMKKLERKLGSRRLGRVLKNVLHKTWTNGASLSLVSSDEGAEVEGLTASLLVWDEAHRATVERLGKILPYLSVAERSESAHAMLLGIGGSREALLSSKTRDGTFNLCHITPRDMIEYDPSFSREFTAHRRNLGEILYRQHYECEDLDEGERRLLPYIPDSVGYSTIAPPSYIFAIDVGRHTDDTLVGLLEVRPASFVGPEGQQLKVVTLVEAHKIEHVPFPDWYENASTGEVVPIHATGEMAPAGVVLRKGQAHMIYDYIKENLPPWLNYIPPDIVCMERNAIGEGLYDELAMRWIPGLESVYINNDPITPSGEGIKDLLVGRLRDMCRYGQFCSHDPIIRDDLQNVRYEVKLVKDRVMLDIDHSDLLSMILVGLSRLEE